MQQLSIYINNLETVLSLVQTLSTFTRLLSIFVERCRAVLSVVERGVFKRSRLFTRFPFDYKIPPAKWQDAVKAY